MSGWNEQLGLATGMDFHAMGDSFCSVKRGGKKGGHIGPKLIQEGLQATKYAFELFGERHVDGGVRGEDDGWLMNAWTPLVDKPISQILDELQAIIHEISSG